ncbi:Basic region leucine zipper [Seminavis robusta]|uniref:Basic region leucine zipper n=1 Tax=Seminavis robusta TaxID=568900 RepID=A0A9N8D9R2_9STRA|nr:Basic region leucine zipper [Seminavis robusta]|eukprot:Sro6_g005060.1 Basic region leucine zipper (737) ;mRNA; f:87778-90077
MATTEAAAKEGTRTPSPPATTTASSGGAAMEEDVPSPVPASISSTTSSEPSHSHHGHPANSNGSSYMPSVPNPFATANAPAPAGWGNHTSMTGAPAPYGHPPPPHHQHPHHAGAIPMVVSTPAPPPAYHHHPPATHHYAGWARENSCPNFSIGTSDSSNNNSNGPKSPRAKTTARRRYSSKAASTVAATNAAAAPGEGGSVNSRRQKRLERNRESARLSRRRRKQYLEVLEDRVTQLSMELDQGRRAHASQAVTVTVHKRREVLTDTSKPEEERIRMLDHGLARTSPEMMLLATFKAQQLKSFSLPPHSKFVLWLTLQNDQYFRGGRAASERLSAARIGERMLNSGNDRVPPAQSMWPLFCNEVGLSYDQEERVRGFQRTLLQSNDSWLQRHTARAADLAMGAVHDGTQAMCLRLGQRERSMLSVLTPAQKVKLLTWADQNKEKLHRVMQNKVQKHMETAPAKSAFIDQRFKTDKKQHVAANLYIVNYQLQKLMQVFPRAAPLVTGATLRKLSRRPSFESLGRAPEKPGKDDDSLSRDTSFASSSSLKRSCSSLSMDGERPQLLQISPDDAEQTCKPSVDKVLGYLREIIPPTPPVQYGGQAPVAAPGPPPHQQQHHQVVEIRIPSPTQVTSVHYHPTVTLQPQYTQAPVAAVQQHPPQQPLPMAIVSSQPSAPVGQQPITAPPGHRKQSSFIPPYLNVVPEEMFPTDGTADDFLMSLVDDEDWAIGEGIDMDTAD